MYEKMTWGRQLRTQLMLALAALFVIIPVLWMLRLAFDGSVDGTQRAQPKTASLLPDEFSTRNLARAWDAPMIGRSFMQLLTNSMIVAGCTTLVALVFGTLAGYAFARYRFPGRKFGLFAALVLITLPPAGLAAPFFLFLNDLRIRDSLFSLIIVYSVIAVPFALWTVRNAVQGIPKDLEEAARLDGASEGRLFRSVTLPLVAPALAVSGFIAFNIAWSEFALGWVFISSAGNATLAMILYTMRGQNNVSWGTMSALTLLMIIPILALFYALGRYVISGLSLGTVGPEE
jgi:ABC-type glycerol-3-phosphate transport system permease component